LAKRRFGKPPFLYCFGKPPFGEPPFAEPSFGELAGYQITTVGRGVSVGIFLRDKIATKSTMCGKMETMELWTTRHDWKQNKLSISIDFSNEASLIGRE
jgi:hypothetical protein